MSADKLKWQVNRAVRNSNLPSTARLIMFVLSDMADVRTGVIPESKKLPLRILAKETGLGESTVKTQLALLERLGWVIRSRPTAGEQARHAATDYRIQVGRAGEERGPHKRKPGARSKPPKSETEGQEQAPGGGQEIAPEIESGGQEQAVRGPGDSSSGARSKPPYIKDDDPYDQNNEGAPDVAPPPAPSLELPEQRKRSGGTRKTAKAKDPDPIDDAAQELTVAFFDRYKGRNVQPFPAVRGVVKSALKDGVPRDVLARAMDSVVTNGFAISGSTLSVELTRMWNAANPSAHVPGARRPSAMEQRIHEGAERAERMRERDEAEARGEHIPSLLSLPPGRIA